ELAAVHPDVPEVPGPLEELHDAIVLLHDLHRRADPGERDQPGKSERLAPHLRVVAERRQHRAAVADVNVGALLGFVAAELEPARRAVLVEAPLTFRRHRRRLAEEPVARPRSGVAALGALAEVVLLRRAAPEPAEVPLVVAARIGVRGADAAGRGPALVLSRGAVGQEQRAARGN